MYKYATLFLNDCSSKRGLPLRGAMQYDVRNNAVGISGNATKSSPKVKLTHNGKVITAIKILIKYVTLIIGHKHLKILLLGSINDEKNIYQP